MRTATVIALLAAFTVVGVGCEYRMWHECLATNSWFYCARVLGK